MSETPLKVILIGGTSHVGKSTLAQHLSETLGWKVVATDSLARHPGRPWKVLPETVPLHVAEHYLSFSVNELLADGLRHYRKLWPIINDLVIRREAPLIVEGSALWPEWVAAVASPDVTALWLTASDDFLRQRIYVNSGPGSVDNEQQEMIRKFAERTFLYNRRMIEAVQHLELLSTDAEGYSLEALTEKYLKLLNAW